jgi:hypothetical protein
LLAPGRLTELATKEHQLLINRPVEAPLLTWEEYVKRTKGIDEERVKLRKELF